MRMKVLDLFSGIGGFSLGLERAGMETVAFCEIEEYPRKVLANHWPDVPIHKDIRELDGRQYRGTVGLVCGGFPCQPFSAAGKRAGKNDDRDLWPEMFRVIREVQPSWIIGENVAGFINMELDRTLSDLESSGYACQTFDIPACGVDAPHIRHRVWVVAHRSGTGRRENARSSYAYESQHEGRSETQTNISASDGEGCRAGNLANTSSQRWQGGKPESETKGRLDLRGRARGNQEQDLRQPAKWPVEPAVGRVANGIPRRVDRLRGLGNAVVPQIPEIIGRAILEL